MPSEHTHSASSAFQVQAAVAGQMAGFDRLLLHHQCLCHLTHLFEGNTSVGDAKQPLVRSRHHNVAIEGSRVTPRCETRSSPGCAQVSAPNIDSIVLAVRPNHPQQPRFCWDGHRPLPTQPCSAFDAGLGISSSGLGNILACSGFKATHCLLWSRIDGSGPEAVSRPRPMYSLRKMGQGGTALVVK